MAVSADLNYLMTDRTLVVVDVEGAEFSLLNPDHAPALRKADLLIEIHEGQGAGATISVEQSMRERFQETHQLTWRRSLDRKSSVEQFSTLWKGKIEQEEFAAMLDEGRSASQAWLWAKAKSSVSASVSVRGDREGCQCQLPVGSQK
jgi:hypothetical protein